MAWNQRVGLGSAILLLATACVEHSSRKATSEISGEPDAATDAPGATDGGVSEAGVSVPSDETDAAEADSLSGEEGGGSELSSVEAGPRGGSVGMAGTDESSSKAATEDQIAAADVGADVSATDGVSSDPESETDVGFEATPVADIEVRDGSYLCGSNLPVPGVGVFDTGNGTSGGAWLGRDTFLTSSDSGLVSTTLWSRDDQRQLETWVGERVVDVAGTVFLTSTSDRLRVRDLDTGVLLLTIETLEELPATSGLSERGQYVWYATATEVVATDFDGLEWVRASASGGDVFAGEDALRVVTGDGLMVFDRDGSFSAVAGPFGPFAESSSAPAFLGSEGHFVTHYLNTLYVFTPRGELGWELLNDCNGPHRFLVGDRVWCETATQLVEFELAEDTEPESTFVATVPSGLTAQDPVALKDSLLTKQKLFLFAEDGVQVVELPPTNEDKVTADATGWISERQYGSGDEAVQYGCGAPQAILRTATDVVVGTRFGGTFAFGLEDGSLRWHLPVADLLRGVTPDGKQVVAWNTLYEIEPKLARVRDLTLRQKPGIGPGHIEAVAPDLSYYMECITYTGAGDCNVRRVDTDEIVEAGLAPSGWALGNGGVRLLNTDVGPIIGSSETGESSSYSFVTGLEIAWYGFTNLLHEVGAVYLEQGELLLPSGGVETIACTPSTDSVATTDQAYLVPEFDDTFYLAGSLCRIDGGAEGLPEVAISALGYAPEWLLEDVAVYREGSRVRLAPWRLE